MGTKTTGEKRSDTRDPKKTPHERALTDSRRFYQLRLTEGDDGRIHVPTKIQLFRTGTYEKWDPEKRRWLKFTIAADDLAAMAENWKKNVRGVDLALDFGHKSDEEAAAWFTNVTLEEKGTELWAEVEWTPDGKRAVAAKKYRYVSPDFAFAWRDNETGEDYGPTLFGAGLTNRPVIKNMAPTVELTEVNEMAKKKTAPKKLADLTKEELELRLSEETDEEKKELLQLRLDEMSDADGDDDGDDDTDEDGDGADAKKKKAPKKKGADDMTFEELKEAYAKQCEEMAEMSKKMASTMAEIEKSQKAAAKAKKESEFQLLLTEGKVVPAQKDAFMSGDMEKFVKLSEPLKFKAVGGTGGGAATKETSAQDEVLKLAEEKVKSGARRGEAISLVLAEKPDLRKRYEMEMEGTGAEA